MLVKTKYVNLLLASSVVVFLLAGCTSKNTKNLISQYANTSVKVEQALAKTYDKTKEDELESKVLTALRDGAAINDLKIDDIDFSGQTKTMKALINYSEALVAIASDDIFDKIDENSAKLQSSLQTLSNNPNLSAQYKVDPGVISISVNAIARGYTEYTRQKALKKILNDSNATVQASIGLLRKDIPALKMITKVSLQKNLNLRMYFLNNPNRCKTQPKATCVDFDYTIQGRIDEYKNAMAIKNRIDNLDKEFGALDSALNGLLSLGAKTVESINKDESMSYEGIQNDIETIKTHLNELKEFQKNSKE